MKNIFITIYTLFYLLATLGFPSVQHYCHMQQRSVEQSSTDCCCSMPAHECRTPEAERTKLESCCAADETFPQSNAADARIVLSLQENCCETLTRYFQVDGSTTIKVFDTTTNIACPFFTSIIVPECQFTVNKNLLVSTAEPFQHVNLPLLI